MWHGYFSISSIVHSFVIGKWEMGSGITMTKSMSRWARRDDLQGANIINSLSPFLCWADYTKDENGEIIGSEGYFQASSTARQAGLLENMFFATSALHYLSLLTFHHDKDAVEINKKYLLRSFSHASLHVPET